MLQFVWFSATAGVKVLTIAVVQLLQLFNYGFLTYSYESWLEKNSADYSKLPKLILSGRLATSLHSVETVFPRV